MIEGRTGTAILTVRQGLAALVEAIVSALFFANGRANTSERLSLPGNGFASRVAGTRRRHEVFAGVSMWIAKWAYGGRTPSKGEDFSRFARALSPSALNTIQVPSSTFEPYYNGEPLRGSGRLTVIASCLPGVGSKSLRHPARKTPLNTLEHVWLRGQGSGVESSVGDTLNRILSPILTLRRSAVPTAAT